MRILFFLTYRKALLGLRTAGRSCRVPSNCLSRVLCIGILMAGATSGLQALEAESASAYQPFQAGDRFVYNLYWSLGKVGEAELSFDADTVPGKPEQEALRMTFSVRTVGLVNLLYPVNNRLQTWLDFDKWHPLHHTKQQSEGRRERDLVLYFDRCEGTVVYEVDGEKRDAIEIPPGTQDPLSLFSSVARYALELGKTFEFPATDGGKPLTMSAEVLAEESLKTPLGFFETFKLAVATGELRGVFARSPDAPIEIWFSADPYRLPLRLVGTVSVGTFWGELAAFESEWIKSAESVPSWTAEAPVFRARRAQR